MRSELAKITMHKIFDENKREFVERCLVEHDHLLIVIFKFYSLF